MASVTTQPIMTLDEIRATRDWAALTPKQKAWAESFIATNGDFFLATKAAYNTKSDLNAQILSHEIRNNPRVVAVLDKYFGRTEQDERKEFFDLLQRKIKKGKITVAEAEVIKVICAERKWDVPEDISRANGSKKVYAIGDTILANGRATRITKLDKNHQPLEGEPL